MSIKALPNLASNGWLSLLLFILLLPAMLLLASAVRADTLEQAFAQAYASNAAIQAQQAQVRASGYDLQKARAGYKPEVSVGAGIGTAHNDLASPLFPFPPIRRTPKPPA